MDGEDASWCLIESDPAVFTELCRMWGVENVEFKEIYGTDEAAFAEHKRSTLGETLGFIFLFKWEEAVARQDAQMVDSDVDPTAAIFFSAQVIRNACATFAILSILMNRDDVVRGDALEAIKSFAADFDPQTRGLAISNSDTLREAHNSFRQHHAISVNMNLEDSKKSDDFHYVAYLPIHGRLYELDGLRSRPVDLGECAAETWQDQARAAIAEKIQRVQEASQASAAKRAAEGNSSAAAASGEEIRFALMALTEDQLLHHRKRLAVQTGLSKKLAEAAGDQEAAKQFQPDVTGLPARIVAMVEKEVGAAELPEGTALLQARRAALEREICGTSGNIALEQQKQENWKRENELRRFNFLPLILACMRQMARKESLKPAFEEAKTRKAARGAAQNLAS